jgi:hypothetical protein
MMPYGQLSLQVYIRTKGVAALPAASFVPEGVATIIKDPQTQTVEIRGPLRNYIFAPFSPNAVGVVDAGTDPHPLVQQTNYATVDTVTIVDQQLAIQYAQDPQLQQHILDSMLARVGTQLYGTTWANQTNSTISQFDTIYHPDGRQTAAFPTNVISYSINTNATITGNIRVQVQARVTPETIEEMKRRRALEESFRLMAAIRSKMKTVAIHVKKNNKSRRCIPADHKVDPRELKARETLREMITESEYRRYLTNGFIMAKGGQSGLWYQIFSKAAGHWVFSYKDGKMYERLCIHTDSSCPQTDHVINMKVLAEIDEETLRKGANITTDYYYDPVIRQKRIGDLETSEIKQQERLLDTYLRVKQLRLAASA